MDYDNDQEWQSYYASMMIANSPGNLSYCYPERYASSPPPSPPPSPPYGRFGERIDDGGEDRLYEGGDVVVGRDVSYEDEEERDCGEEEEEEEAETLPARESSGSSAGLKKEKKKKRAGDDSSRRKKRKRRDPNKPKGCLTAVLLYSNANRARVKVENPDLNFGDIVSFFASVPPYYA